MADDTHPIIEDSDLAGIIAREISSSQNFDQSELSGKRSLAVAYRRGEMPDLPSRPNGSTQTSRDFADTMQWILPGVVRVFTGSDRMVEFEATQEGGEQAAEESSELMNYGFFRENDGYRILYNATSDSLEMGNGVAASYWDPPQDETKIFRNKLPEELAQLIQDEGWQPLTQKSGTPRQIEQPDGSEVGMPTLTVKMGRTKKRGKICDLTCKPENLELNSEATTIEGARYVGYLHDDKTRSDLYEMADQYGWDRKVIEDLPTDTAISSSSVQDARNADRVVDRSSPVKSGDHIDLREIYLRADMDGDGIAEMLQCWFAGKGAAGQLLGWEEWEDDVPFTDIPCYPVPHRWDAEGVFDRTADIQRVKTTLLRQALDNGYAAGLPMREVEEGSVLNADILINPKFGGIIWKKKASAPIVNYDTAFVADKLFAALEYMDTMIAKRTGVSKTIMALDPEALQNQTATASQNQRDAGYSQIELIARNMAELGWSKFFAKRRNLAKKYIKGTISIPSKNGPPGPDGKPTAYRSMQPENWSDDMAVTINVGLGTGSRDRDMAMLSTIQNDQMVMASMLGQYGFSQQAIDFIPKIIKTATQKAEAAGIKNPDSYYPQIDENAAQQMKQQASQPKPDPAILLEQERGKTAVAVAQANGQITLQVEQGKLQAQQAAEAARLQVDQQNLASQSQAQVTREAAQLQADMQTKQADRENALVVAQNQGAIDLQKQANDLAFKQWQTEQQTSLEREKMAHAAHIASQKPAPQATKGAN